MTNSCTPNPRVWTSAELEVDAQTALDAFVDRRLAEPGGTYITHVKASRAALIRLFRKLAGFDPLNPSVALIRTIIRDEELFSALRYVAGPPVSSDDIGVLVTRRIEKVSKKALSDDTLPLAVLELLCRLSDPYRFPWVAQHRPPTTKELRNAIAMTSVLHATQSLQTERRRFGKVVEQSLQTRLIEMGFLKISGRKKSGETLPTYPPKGKITQPSHHPTYPYFYGECTVYGRKVDLFIALKNGRMIALEAKDSSSALNSTKRLLNDTAAKAKHYRDAGGNIIISVALLSGVFKLADLIQAQNDGLYLVWAHNLDEFVEWIRSQS